MNNAQRLRIVGEMKEIKINADDFNELYKKLAEDKDKHCEQLRKLYCKAMAMKFEVQLLRMEYAATVERHPKSNRTLNEYEQRN